MKFTEVYGCADKTIRELGIKSNPLSVKLAEISDSLVALRRLQIREQIKPDEYKKQYDALIAEQKSTSDKMMILHQRASQYMRLHFSR